MLRPEFVMRALVERLNWPVRLARWRAATEFAALLSSPMRALATHVLLDWLESRVFETEVVAGLSVLTCAEPKDLPPARDVKRSVEKPSVLADLLFQRIYNERLGGWASRHSGLAPDDHQEEAYFDKHIGQVIPTILSTKIEELEHETGLPFRSQWAFEWRRLMEATNSPHSTYPYYFINRGTGREGLLGQFSQRQCDVYRSAFLRTLALAVDRWRMPPNRAVTIATHCLPLSKGLHALRPGARPGWLKDLPEMCCKPSVSLEMAARQLTKLNVSLRGARPVSLRIPISNAIAEFGELSIESFYASKDFAPKDDFAENHRRILIWHIPDLVSFGGLIPAEKIGEYRIAGKSGSCVPVCLDTMPLPFGFWQNDYFQLGLAFPAPYNFETPLLVEPKNQTIGFSTAGSSVGRWRTWNDNWSPIYAAEGGHTRCGSVTELKNSVLERTMAQLEMGLSWQVTLRTWERPDEYHPVECVVRSSFFRE